MLGIRQADARGTTHLGWLDSRHSFSFGSYYDPAHLGFADLVAINDDRVAPGEGFPTHGHRDMEILTYVLDGAVEHRDTLGNRAVIRAGEVQRMTAGRGVRHSEYNASDNETLRFLQIWIRPDAKGLAPAYEQRAFDPAGLQGGLVLIASADGRDHSLLVHQDVDLLAARLTSGQRVGHVLEPGRTAWLQVARGSVRAAGRQLVEGDGLALDEAGALEIEGIEDAEILLFDLAGDGRAA